MTIDENKYLIKTGCKPIQSYQVLSDNYKQIILRTMNNENEMITAGLFKKRIDNGQSSKL